MLELCQADELAVVTGEGRGDKPIKAMGVLVREKGLHPCNEITHDGDYLVAQPRTIMEKLGQRGSKVGLGQAAKKVFVSSDVAPCIRLVYLDKHGINA